MSPLTAAMPVREQAAPFRTIQHAADLAQPGDVITVHEGVYRERISPPRDGESDAQRIVYQAAAGREGRDERLGSRHGLGQSRDDTWKATLPNSFFGGFNPYSDLIHGDWFNPNGRTHHTGAVYLNGDWLTEAATLDDVMEPAGSNAALVRAGGRQTPPSGRSSQGVNPNEQLVEINVRRTVFYPAKDGHQLHHRARLHPGPRRHARGRRPRPNRSV